MFVPKATVNKNHCLIFWKYNVRATRERPDIFSISESMGKKVFSNQLFRFRVFTSDVRHIHAADFFAVVISHCPHLLRDRYSRF